MSLRTLTCVVAAVAIASSSAFAEPPDDAKKYVNHLKDEDYEAEKGDDYVQATHDSHLNMVLKKYKGGVLLQAYYDTGARELNAIKLMEMVNRLNTNATVARYYIDDENDTMIEAWYPGKYDEKQFDKFLTAWHGDTSGQYSIIQEYFGD